MSLGTREADSRLAGRYRLGRRLGSGGMAEVFLADDLRLGRAVAVKVLRPELASIRSVRQRFETEARVAGRLSHPHAVAVYDVGEAEGRPFLVMELVEGGTLAERLAQGPLDQTTARRLILEVLSALEAAHAAGLLHRDIKPANILLSAEGSAKLADFGIAKAIRPRDAEARDETTDVTAVNTVIGTARYMPPERALGQRASVESDLWSVGLVLYETLGGRRPDPDTPGAVIPAGVSPVPPVSSFRPGIDPSIDRVIARALDPDPRARYPSAAAMAAALAGEDATEVMPAAVAVGWVGRTPPGGGRIPWARLGVAAMLIGAVVTLGLALDSGQAKSPAPPRQSTTTATVAPVVTTLPAPPPAPTPTARPHHGPGSGPGAKAEDSNG